MTPRTFRPVRKATAADEIIDQIKALVRANRFTPGSRLPSERELARTLGVSRPTVREALRTLELMGVVRTRHGSGTEVAGSGSQVLKAPLEFLLALDQPSIADLHETRELLEVHLAGRAAVRRTAEDLRVMEGALEEMRRSLSDPSRVTDPDVRFHQAIATAAHNPLLERVMHCLGDNLRSLIHAAWPGNRSMQFSQKSHQKIYDAIRRKNPEAARRAMAEHMRVTGQELRRAGLLNGNGTHRLGNINP